MTSFSKVSYNYGAQSQAQSQAQAQHYEKLLQRIGELEMDLGQTVAANSRLAADVESLQKVHKELVDAYERVRTQHTSAKKALGEERQRYSRLEQEFSQQLNEWHDKMLHKAKELEELQQLGDPAREMEMMRLKVSEELEALYQDRLEAADKRADLEARKFSDAKRQIEVLRLELAQKSKEILNFEQETQSRLEVQKKVYQEKIASLQSDLDKNASLAATTTTLRQQVYERAAKNKSLLSEMEEMEVRHKSEVELLRREITSSQSEARSSQSRARELESDLLAVKREKEDLSVRQLGYVSEVEQAREDLLRLQNLQSTEIDRERVKQDLLTRVKTAETDAEMSKKELEVKEQELSRLKMRCDQLCKEVADATGEADQRIADAEVQVSAEKEATSHALASLKSEVEHLRTQLRDKETSFARELAECETKLETLTAESSQLRLTCSSEEKKARENEFRAREYDNLHKQHAELERQNRELVTTHSSLKTTYDATVDENRTLVARLEEVNKLSAENRKRLENDSEKQLETIRGTLEKAEGQLNEKDRMLSKVRDESKHIASASKKKIESQKLKTKQLLNRYAELATEKEQVLRIAETNKKKYELQMLQVHKLLNDPALRDAMGSSTSSLTGTQSGGLDTNLGFLKELQSIRDCLDDAIYSGNAVASAAALTDTKPSGSPGAAAGPG
ncbi:unnamed protein product [Amoebophrya sp. A25]|nr:unnamed protein product [Amoebophrya sp. A25]|eukprot:GSA25T00023890001.1